MYATYLQYVQGTFKVHSEIAKEVATAAPYKEWVNSNHRLEDLVPTNQYLQETQMELSQVLRLQAANGTKTSPQYRNAFSLSPDVSEFRFLVQE